ncbi:MAG: class I SAM-dependent methyltransferase [Elusimicrobia bacterium]|nr:class I SAM-dependent methyltransferase [Candidatus Obscuribacterium magneticum]
MDRDKEEAVKQWTHDPCGLPDNWETLETKEFYESIDRNRFEVYAPWLKNAVNFSNYRAKKVLEIGYGLGTDLFQFAAAGADVYGIDLTPRHYEMAKRRFDFYGTKSVLLIGDAEKLPFPSDTFDLVYSFGVLHHTPNITLALAEIYRVLKQGGEAVIGVYNKASVYFLLGFLFPSYLMRFRFLKESYRRHMSRIEYRKNSDACPLVRVYTARGLRTLLKDFKHVVIQRYHLKKEHFGPFRFFVSNELISKLEPHAGWYLIAKAVK